MESRKLLPCKQLEILLTANYKKSLAEYPDRDFFGFFCSYFPEELILAAGMEPLRILPQGGGANPPELPAFCCSLARGSLGLAVKGEFTNLKGVGFAHTCDTMQCLSGIWAERLGKDITVTLVPPVILGAPGSKEYLRAELEIALNKLSALNGHISAAEELERAVALCQEIRNLVHNLERLRGRVPSNLLSQILRAGQVMPRQDYLEALGQVLPYLEQTYPEEKGTKVLLSGAVFEEDSLFTMLEGLGARVVVDDTCTGARHYSNTAANASPLDRITQRLLEMPPCPCRSSGLDARLEYLLNGAQGAGVKGAIIAVRKFCDPHAWDAVPLNLRLKTEGIRTLLLELEGSAVGEAERTRLQAFMETL